VIGTLCPQRTQHPSGFDIPKIELTTRAKVPGMTAERFAAVAADATVNCPVSKALAGVEITLDAALV
jgi:osmotically inducible protein OsmC